MMSVIFFLKARLAPYYYNKLVPFHHYVLSIFDKFKGVDFMKNVSIKRLGLDESIAEGYEPIDSKKIKIVLEALNINKEDSILDIGCSKGKAMYEMSKFPFKKIDGVEISKELVLIARKNLNKLDLENIDIYNTNAELFTGLDKYNYIYFFNPFPKSVFRIVMDNIEVSLIKNPRLITIIYFYPFCHDEVVKSGFFHAYQSQKRLIVYKNKFNNL